MEKTLDLLEKAMQAYEGKSQREISVALGFGPTTLGTAKTRGKLSPTAAGLLAEKLGEDAVYWTAIAGLESERASKARDSLIRRAANWRKLLLPNLMKTARRCGFFYDYTR